MPSDDIPPARDAGITYSGGPGDSPATAIRIEGAPSHQAGIAAEYEYLEAHFGPPMLAWRLQKQSLERHEGRPYDRLDIVLADGSARCLYFDLSDFFGPR